MEPKAKQNFLSNVNKRINAYVSNNFIYGWSTATLYALNLTIIFILAYSYKNQYDSEDVDTAIAMTLALSVSDIFIFLLFVALSEDNQEYYSDLGILPRKIFAIYSIHYYVAFIPYYFGYWYVSVLLVYLSVPIWTIYGLYRAICFLIKNCLENCKYVEQELHNDIENNDAQGTPQ